MNNIKIIGLLIRDRIKEAGKTQEVLNASNHLIKSRLGFHEVSSQKCSRVGMVLLQLQGEPKEWDPFINKLLEIEGLEVQSMDFTF